MKTKSFYTAIGTNDLPRTLSFYVGALGFHVAHRMEMKNGGSVVVLENDDDAKLEIIEMKGPEVGFHALRTNVDDIELAEKELTESGYEIIAGPLEIAPGIALIVRDPNGVVIEIIQHIRK